MSYMEACEYTTWDPSLLVKGENVLCSPLGDDSASLWPEQDRILEGVPILYQKSQNHKYGHI